MLQSLSHGGRGVHTPRHNRHTHAGEQRARAQPVCTHNRVARHRTGTHNTQCRGAEDSATDLPQCAGHSGCTCAHIDREGHTCVHRNIEGHVCTRTQVFKSQRGMSMQAHMGTPWKGHMCAHRDTGIHTSLRNKHTGTYITPQKGHMYAHAYTGTPLRHEHAGTHGHPKRCAHTQATSRGTHGTCKSTWEWALYYTPEKSHVAQAKGTHTRP